ncbi:MAG: winged helix-turn-helix transcriptional regulator [Clostridia bacterium]|nr:winged helix-turn-helix transcriptional regulator [Clostridia bacterium]
MQQSFMPEIAVCDCESIHEDVIAAVRGQMPEEDLMIDMAEAFRIFGDSTRVRILFALKAHEMCVCDISVLLGMTKSAVSHQLRILKQVNLVKHRKVGRVVYYSLADEHVETIFSACMEHVMEE